MQVLVEGLQEQSRWKMMDELRRLIMVDNYEAVKIGDLKKYSVALHVSGTTPTRKTFQRQRYYKYVEIKHVSRHSPLECQSQRHNLVEGKRS